MNYAKTRARRRTIHNGEGTNALAHTVHPGLSLARISASALLALGLACSSAPPPATPADGADAGRSAHDAERVEAVARARHAISAHLYSAARTELVRLIEEAPLTAVAGDEAVYLLAESYFNQHLWQDAKAYYQRYLRAFPQGGFATEAIIKLRFIEENPNGPRVAPEPPPVRREAPTEDEAEADGGFSSNSHLPRDGMVVDGSTSPNSEDGGRILSDGRSNPSDIGATIQWDSPEILELKARLRAESRGFGMGDDRPTAAPTSNETPVFLNNASLEEEPETAIGGAPNEDAQPLMRERPRLIAAQVGYLFSDSISEVERELARIRDAGFNTVILKVFRDRGEPRYPFADGSAEAGVYFRTSEAPIIDDVLRPICQLARELDLKIFAWMNTRDAFFGLNDKHLRSSVRYDIKSKSLIQADGMSLFEDRNILRIEKLFHDLAGYELDGILIHDDLIMRYDEDFSRQAKLAYKRRFGSNPTPATIFEDAFVDSDAGPVPVSDGEFRARWSAWKKDTLYSVVSTIVNAVRKRRSGALVALSMPYEVITSPKKAVDWYAQDALGALNAGVDYLALRGFHREIKADLNSEKRVIEVLQAVIAGASNLTGDPNRVLLRLQGRDWKNGDAIPPAELNPVLGMMRATPSPSFALSPVDDKLQLPNLRGLARNQ